MTQIQLPKELVNYIFRHAQTFECVLVSKYHFQQLTESDFLWRNPEFFNLLVHKSQQIARSLEIGCSFLLPQKICVQLGKLGTVSLTIGSKISKIQSFTLVHKKTGHTFGTSLPCCAAFGNFLHISVIANEVSVTDFQLGLCIKIICYSNTKCISLQIEDANVKSNTFG